MNTIENERFHELAHRALAKQAAPAEQRELGAMIAENPNLKEELERMGGEAAVLREILPLLEDLQHPIPDIPPPPMTRLRKEVGEAFAARAKSKNELGELLGRLENWARKQAGSSCGEVMAMVSVLRGSILGARGEDLQFEEAMIRAPEIAYGAPRLREEAEANVRAQELRRRQDELMRRLRSLESRIRQAEEISHDCRNEVRGLLEAFAREREIVPERPWQDINPIPKQET